MIIYGNSKLCQPCIDLKSYLDDNQIQYQFRDLASEDFVERTGYKKELHNMGISKIPCAVIKGEVYVGQDIYNAL